MAEKDQAEFGKDRKRFSRRSFIGGAAVGAAGVWGLSYGLDRFGPDPARPPDFPFFKCKREPDHWSKP